jgi:predicted transcriptional regulator
MVTHKSQKWSIREAVINVINRKSTKSLWTSKDITKKIEADLKSVSNWITYIRRAGYIKRVGTSFDRCSVYKKTKKITPYWLDDK